jgi:hypothetical protein
VWRTLACALVALVAAVSGMAQAPSQTRAPSIARPSPGLPEHADRIVDYRIAVALDTNAREVKGRERLTWRNTSGDRVPDLWFHLYLNAFRNDQSTFFRESGGQLRGDYMPHDGWGHIDITSMTLADGTDLTGALRFEAPDDGNPDDRTVARVPLPKPVAPGESVTLDIAFTSRLPKVFARTGYHDDFYLVGQWFPKIAVYEPAGMRGRTTGGWNCHQFHANSEFYADFGRYDVEFTVPSNYVVGATGERKEAKTSADGTTTYRYVQDDVHDFVWTADPDYVEQRHRFVADLDVTHEEYTRTARLLDRSEQDVQLSDVEIILLIQPRHLAQAPRYVQSAKAALKWFGLWYGRYPYRTLTVVDPAPGAAGAGGMEYPTFITGGTHFTLNSGPFSNVRVPELVTIHEFGHQFWYGLVASNEFEEAWLDEGLNSYSTARILDREYGRDTSQADIPGLKLGALDSARISNRLSMRFDRVRQPAWTYQGSTYGFYSYQKPELLLGTLERHLGEETMARVMRTYHERWRFRHPSSDDFYAVANEVSGRDLTWFFEQAVEGTEPLDYRVSRVSTRPAPNEQYESTVTVERATGFVHPVDIALKFEGQPPERFHWDGRETWKRWTFVRATPIEWADVDPDRKILLDTDWLNNARRVTPDNRTSAAWSARWLFWMQQVAATVGW